MSLDLSVAIISFNEEENIARTLEAIKDIAREIIVVDSHSTDNTRQIAKSFGAKVVEQDWLGHIGQKNFALDLCECAWILSLDCDEVVDDDLKQNIIKAVKKNDTNIGYKINRRTFYLGKLLKYSWQKDIKFRLFARSKKARWGGYNPHDVLECDIKKELLNGEIVHYSYKNILDHFNKTANYAFLTAKSYHKMGKKFHYYKLFLSPLSSFIKDYFLKKAFLDGFAGLVVGVSSWLYVFLKYANLKELERENS